MVDSNKRVIFKMMFDSQEEDSNINLTENDNQINKTDLEKMYDDVQNRIKYEKVFKKIGYKRTYFWKENEDSGFDLFVPKDITFKKNQTILIDFGVKCEMVEGFFGKTPEEYCPWSVESESENCDYDLLCSKFDEMINNFDNIPYYLYARSSIYKYDLLMMNNVGIIDKGYRGNIKACVKWVGNEETNDISHPNYSETFTLKKGTRICQICHPYLKPFNTMRVEKLSESVRGAGGHGSTGK